MDFQECRNNFLGHCLIEALDEVNFEAVKFILVQHKADPNALIYEQEIAPLHYAVGCENLEMAEKSVQFMLEHCDANPNVRCQEDLTPLHIAAMNGRSTILTMLLAFGGEVHAIDIYKRTPVHYAISERHFDCVRIIQNYQFELNFEKKRQVLSMMIEEPTPSKNNRLEFLRSQDGFDDYLSASQLEQSKYTPNHKNFNYNASSPYYIDLTDNGIQQKSKAQRKITLQSDDDEDKENEAIFQTPQCQTNLFELTEDNLWEFSQSMSMGKACGRRVSFINSWRDKIKQIRRHSALKKNFNKIENFITNFDTTQDGADLTITSIENVDGTQYFSAGPQKTPARVLNEQKSADNEHTPVAVKSKETCRFSGSKGIVYNFDRTSPFYVNITHRNKSASRQSSINQSDSMEVPAIIVTAPSDDISPVAEETLKMRSPEQTTNIIIQTEGYVHSDVKNDVVFFEKKINLNPVMAGNVYEQNPMNHTASTMSTAFTIPLDYESDMLRQELTQFGEPPGPITKTTKKIYIKKLIKYKRNPNYSEEAVGRKDQKIKPSIFDDLQNTFQNPKWTDHLQVYFQYEQQMIKEFKESAASMKREFREGHLKKSFIYLLIDPAMADNLPLQHQFMDFQQVWQRFINSIFYVGKGIADRPYAHLYDAIKLYSQTEVVAGDEEIIVNAITPATSSTKLLEKVSEDIELNEKTQLDKLTTIHRKKKMVSCNLFGSPNTKGGAAKLSPKIPKKSQADSEKLKKILNIWNSGNGVVCLHVFHNLMPVEAYTREAAIIDCLSLQRLTNRKRGDYYGIAKLWNMKMKKKLGMAFLYRALNVYLHEGETQIMPNDLI